VVWETISLSHCGEVRSRCIFLISCIKYTVDVLY